MEGVITRIGKNKGGYPIGIITAGGNTYYFDSRNLKGCTFDNIKNGDKVIFDDKVNPFNGNKCADNISLCDTGVKVIPRIKKADRKINVNREILEKAGQIVHDGLINAFSLFVDDDLWNKLIENDSERPNKILGRFKEVNDLDLQACQKLLVYDDDLWKPYEDIFKIGDKKRYIDACYKAIECRNNFSHTKVEDNVFSPKYLIDNLENYNLILEPLFKNYATRPFYEDFISFKDKQLVIHTPKIYSIEKLIMEEFQGKSKEDIFSACGRYDITICEDNSCIRTADYDVVIKQIREYFDKQQNENQVVLKDAIPNAQQLVGRTDLFDEIHERLHSGKQIVALQGMGGMGKSCAAIRYAELYKDEYEQIQHIYYDTSIFDTVLKLSFWGLSENEMSDKEKYDLRIEHLLSFDEKTLIIIDNMNVEKDEYFEDLKKCKCHIIITTRMESIGGDEYTVPLKPLQDSEQWELFELHYGKKVQERDKASIEKLFEVVQGHTLLIELSAKTIRNGDLSAEDIIKDLLGQAEEITDEVRAKINERTDQETLDGFIRKIFDVSSLSSEEQNVLMYLSLAPIEGIGRPTLKNLISLKNNNIINSLKEKSWIILNENEDPVMIHLHPIICKVSIEKMKPNYSKCADFLVALLDKIKKSNNEYNQAETQSLCGIARNLMNIIDFSSLNQITFAYELSYEVSEKLYYKYAFDMYLKVIEDLDLINASMNEKYKLYIELYEKIAEICIRLADYSEAIGYFKKSIELHQKFVNDLTISHLFNKLAFVYRKSSKYEDALSYYNRSREMLEGIGRLEDEQELELATTYNDLGIVYLNLNQYEKAIEYYMNGLELREGNPKANNMDRAYSYHNVGTAYQKMKNYEKALEYHEKALQIRREELPSTHPDIAASLGQIGNDYMGSKDYEKALGMYEEALKIRITRFGEFHPDTAWTYFNISSWYVEQKKYIEALEKISKVINIRERTIGEAHAYTAQAIYHEGSIYFKMGKYEKAVSSLRKAEKIQRANPSLQVDLLKTQKLIDEILKLK